MNARQRQQLRADVAQEVMGWCRREIAWAYDGTAACWHSKAAAALVTCHAWRPDEDADQSEQVLNRMLELGFRCSLELGAGDATVTFVRNDARGSESHADRRVAMLLAAVAAVR